MSKSGIPGVEQIGQVAGELIDGISGGGSTGVMPRDDFGGKSPTQSDTSLGYAFEKPSTPTVYVDPGKGFGIATYGSQPETAIGVPSIAVPSIIYGSYEYLAGLTLPEAIATIQGANAIANDPTSAVLDILGLPNPNTFFPETRPQIIPNINNQNTPSQTEVTQYNSLGVGSLFLFFGVAGLTFILLKKKG